MARFVAFCRRLLALVVPVFATACSPGPRSFVDIEKGDVHIVAEDVEGLRKLLASSGLRPAELGIEGELAGLANSVEIDDSGRVWSLDLEEVPALDGLEALSGLPRLSRVRILGAALTDLRGLSKLPRLRHLMIIESGLKGVAGLESNRELRVLDLRGNALTSLADLPDLPELRVLDLSANQIADVGDAIAGRDRLESLTLSHNHLTSASGIGELPSLERLHLNNNRLQSLDGLVGMPRLRELLVNANRLGDASAVDFLPALELVNLNANHLREFPRLVDRLAGHLWQDNPGARDHQIEAFDEKRRRELEVSLAENLPGGELEGSWSRGGCSWTGNRPRCAIRIPHVEGAGSVYLARFDPARLSQDRRRHPVTVSLRLSVESGTVRAYLARRADGYPYIEVVPNSPATLIGELFSSDSGVWFVLEIVDGSATNVKYRVEPR